MDKLSRLQIQHKIMEDDSWQDLYVDADKYTATGLLKEIRSQSEYIAQLERKLKDCERDVENYRELAYGRRGWL